MHALYKTIQKLPSTTVFISFMFFIVSSAIISPMPKNGDALKWALGFVSGILISRVYHHVSRIVHNDYDV